MSNRRPEAVSYRVHEPVLFRLVFVLVLIRMSRLGGTAKEVSPESLAPLMGREDVNRVAVQGIQREYALFGASIPR